MCLALSLKAQLETNQQLLAPLASRCLQLHHNNQVPSDLCPNQLNQVSRVSVTLLQCLRYILGEESRHLEIPLHSQLELSNQ
jgi:hypothetical protein